MIISVTTTTPITAVCVVVVDNSICYSDVTIGTTAGDQDNNWSTCLAVTTTTTVSLLRFYFLNIDSFLLSLILQQRLRREYQEYPRSIAGGQRLIRCDGATDRPYYYLVSIVITSLDYSYYCYYFGVQNG